MTRTSCISKEEGFTSVNTPLLGAFPRCQEDESVSTSQRPQYYVLGLVLTIVFVADLAGGVSKAPLIRVYESIICNEYYRTADPSLFAGNRQVQEQHCKVGPVQEELALLRGWQEFYDYLPGLFLAIPFGILADKYGRKWLSVVNVTSAWARAVWIYIVCAFPHLIPLRLIWLQGAMGIFGGGSLVTSALFLVIATDVTPESQRANVFFYAHGALCATEFFGPPVGSVLMDKSPWIPLALSIVLLTMNIPLSLLLPETLQNSSSPTHRRLSTLDPPKGSPPMISKLRSQLSPPTFLLADYRILCILSASISYIFAQACTNIVTQYTSRRYAWSIAQAAYFGSIRAVIMLFALLVCLPFASTYLLRRRSFSPLKKDILLLRISFTIVAAGLLIEGLAPSIPLFIIGCCFATMGMGATALIRSLLSSLVQQDEVGRLFAVMSLVWTAAMLVASPVVATLFGEGLRQGGVWTGLPFMFAGALFVMATGAMWIMNLNGPSVVEQETKLKEQKEQDEHGEKEKDGLLRPPSPGTPAFGFKVEHIAGPKHATGKHVPTPLVLESKENHSQTGGLRRSSYLETPLFSPGLQIMESRGGFS